jgi:hypothetical protein
VTAWAAESKHKIYQVTAACTKYSAWVLLIVFRSS